MHILFLDQFADLGGAQRCLLEVLGAVAARGWQARLAIPSEGPLASSARALGIPVETLPCGPYRSGSKSSADLLRFAWQAVLQAAAIWKRTPDLLYVDGPRLLPGAAAGARRRVPVLFHCHSLVPPGLQTTVARRALRLAGATVVASCRYVAQPLSAASLHVVYNGVAGPPQPFPAPGTRHIGMLGRIAPQKGQADLLRAARLLPGCRFTLWGDVLFGDTAGTHYLSHLHELARGLPVELAGWQTDVYAALATLDLLVVPSGPEEATTRVILEAFAAGVPVVAYASGGIPEIVEHDRTGILVPERTPEALARAIHDALADPCRLRRLSQAARALWAERFTLDRYRTQILSLLKPGGSHDVYRVFAKQNRTSPGSTRR